MAEMAWDMLTMLSMQFTSSPTPGPGSEQLTLSMGTNTSLTSIDLAGIITSFFRGLIFASGVAMVY